MTFYDSIHKRYLIVFADIPAKWPVQIRTMSRTVVSTSQCWRMFINRQMFSKRRLRSLYGILTILNLHRRRIAFSYSNHNRLHTDITCVSFCSMCIFVMSKHIHTKTPHLCVNETKSKHKRWTARCVINLHKHMCWLVLLHYHTDCRDAFNNEHKWAHKYFILSFGEKCFRIPNKFNSFGYNDNKI